MRNDFTTLLNKGIKRYVAKYIKKRAFGHCEGCKRFDLLIKYEEPNEDTSWSVCEKCYTELINAEEEQMEDLEFSIKDLERILADRNDPEDLFKEEEEFGPCWEIFVDKDDRRLKFLIDGQQIHSCALSRVKTPLSYEGICTLMKIFKTGDVKELKKAIKGK